MSYTKELDAVNAMSQPASICQPISIYQPISNFQSAAQASLLQDPPILDMPLFKSAEAKITSLDLEPQSSNLKIALALLKLFKVEFDEDEVAAKIAALEIKQLHQSFLLKSKEVNFNEAKTGQLHFEYYLTLINQIKEHQHSLVYTDGLLHELCRSCYDLLTLDYIGFFCILMDDAPIALLLSLMHDKLRRFYLVDDELFSSTTYMALEKDRTNKEANEANMGGANDADNTDNAADTPLKAYVGIEDYQIRQQLCAALHTHQALLSQYMQIISGRTYGKWKKVLPQGTKCLIVQPALHKGSMVCPAGHPELAKTQSELEYRFSVFDGLDCFFTEDADTLSFLWVDLHKRVHPSSKQSTQSNLQPNLQTTGVVNEVLEQHALQSIHNDVQTQNPSQPLYQTSTQPSQIFANSTQSLSLPQQSTSIQSQPQTAAEIDVQQPVVNHKDTQSIVSQQTQQQTQQQTNQPHTGDTGVPKVQEVQQSEVLQGIEQKQQSDTQQSSGQNIQAGKQTTGDLKTKTDTQQTNEQKTEQVQILLSAAAMQKSDKYHMLIESIKTMESKAQICASLNTLCKGLYPELCKNFQDFFNAFAETKPIVIMLSLLYTKIRVFYFQEKETKSVALYVNSICPQLVLPCIDFVYPSYIQRHSAALKPYVTTQKLANSNSNTSKDDIKNPQASDFIQLINKGTKCIILDGAKKDIVKSARANTQFALGAAKKQGLVFDGLEILQPTYGSTISYICT